MQRVIYIPSRNAKSFISSDLFWQAVQTQQLQTGNQKQQKYVFKSQSIKMLFD